MTSLLPCRTARHFYFALTARAAGFDMFRHRATTGCSGLFLGLPGDEGRAGSAQRQVVRVAAVGLARVGAVPVDGVVSRAELGMVAQSREPLQLGVIRILVPLPELREFGERLARHGLDDVRPVEEEVHASAG